MNVLVFRVGQLGDTLAALPAFSVVREHFKNDRLTLLSDLQHGKKYVLARDLLRGAGIFDAFMTYTFHPLRALRWLHLAWLLLRLRAGRFDVLVYLNPPERPEADVQRDRRFFRWAGIRQFIGMERVYALPAKIPGQPLPVLPHEADLVLARLAASGITLPKPGSERVDLNLGDAEQRAVNEWLAGLPSDGDRTWIGVAPGSKMASKTWPAEHFQETVAKLISAHDFWPVVLGGSEDAALGDALIATWKRGYNAAGKLNLRASAAALARCRFYLGNDTGTMHLAASVGTPCVAVFSARDYPGRWYPYRVPQRILRTSIECEGCMLFECVERNMECVRAITVDQVVHASEELLTALAPSKPVAPDKIA